eukprot:scaffold248651_cov45-Attheya_sp.AAC.2
MSSSVAVGVAGSAVVVDDVTFTTGVSGTSSLLDWVMVTMVRRVDTSCDGCDGRNSGCSSCGRCCCGCCSKPATMRQVDDSRARPRHNTTLPCGNDAAVAMPFRDAVRKRRVVIRVVTMMEECLS